MVQLTVKAFIKVPIHVSSGYIRLFGKSDQAITQTTEIRAELEKPLELTPVKFDIEDKITYAIEEIEKGKRYQIRFTTKPGQPASYRGILKLKTNYAEKPEIDIHVIARIVK